MSAASDFYLSQAESCMATADATGLAQVRDQNLRAASAWQGMADRVIRMEDARAEKARAAS
jgi:hypothetical protein